LIQTLQGGTEHTEECIPQKGPTKTKRGIHRPGGSRRSSVRERDLHSLLQGLLARPHTNIQTHAGTTLLQAGEHISLPQV
jgi:hypothetical protein